ncbi:hypothetical protein PENSTE_c010G04536 [Penicillium steckii]|uniref:amidase n=1 Tax=Penicillium steckii TaxID=303698 RepID=A0A1V6T872_9EURO|nr:hypothetical protein PENSTE_c010G04536 [Penicillium steckii]
MESRVVSSDSSWEELVARKRTECREKIPTEWLLIKDLKDLPRRLIEYDLPRRSGLLSELELDITENYTATQLLAKLASGETSSLVVTTAFCKRAAIAQQVTSCLTETCFPQALERAQSLDDYLKREGKPMGPLHGLPVSLKDSFDVKGLQSTYGYVELLKHEPANRNAYLVELLLLLGAVLYVKTNVPQTLMSMDSDNNVFGRTLNPHKTSLTAGGSSGGEGALVAFRGSILGVGTDLGGSIRIPALCCGVYGFKPTTSRVPFGDPPPPGVMDGLPMVVTAAGPLGHSISDLKLFMQTVIDDGHAWKYDPSASAVPWNIPQDINLKNNGSLTIGVLSEDKHYPLHPPIKRALQDAVERLTRAGHKIVPIDNDTNEDLSLAYLTRLAFQYFTYAPHVDILAASGEPAVKSIATLWSGPSPMFSGPPPVDRGLDPFQKIQKLHEAKNKFRDAWHRIWVEQKLDAVIAPGAQSTAVGHDKYGWPPYTLVWNVLDYPACMIPFGKASKELDPTNMSTGDGPQPDYIPEEVDGAPCAIQVITPRFQDEKCLQIADVIDRTIQG